MRAHLGRLHIVDVGVVRPDEQRKHDSDWDAEEKDEKRVGCYEPQWPAVHQLLFQVLGAPPHAFWPLYVVIPVGGWIKLMN